MNTSPAFPPNPLLPLSSLTMTLLTTTHELSHILRSERLQRVRNNVSETARVVGVVGSAVQDRAKSLDRTYGAMRQEIRTQQQHLGQLRHAVVSLQADHKTSFDHLAQGIEYTVTEAHRHGQEYAVRTIMGPVYHRAQNAIVGVKAQQYQAIRVLRGDLRDVRMSVEIARDEMSEMAMALTKLVSYCMDAAQRRVTEAQEGPKRRKRRKVQKKNQTAVCGADADADEDLLLF